MDRILRRPLVLGGLLAASCVLLALYQSWLPLRERSNGTSVPWQPGPLAVEVTGQEFGWHFRLAGPDQVLHSADDLTSERILHVPADTEVSLSLTSRDYIYSFSAPELNARNIVVPGLTFTLPLDTTRKGRFELITDPMCSVRLFHDDSMGRIVIEDQAAFDAWYQQQQKRTKTRQ